MKAIVTKELVLVYGIQEESGRGRELQKLFDLMRIPFRYLGEPALGQTVGYLCSLPGYQRRQAPAPGAFGEELLVLLGFSGTRLDQLLGLFRSSGVPKVELKAAVTSTNRDWTLARLAAEIQKEHENMKKI